jgi:hypothetical protein
MLLEFYVAVKYTESYFTSSFWLLLVGYVGANHFLYGIHLLAGTCGAFSEQDTRTLSDLAGVGGMLKAEQQSKCWTRFLWNFSEHRFNDALSSISQSSDLLLFLLILGQMLLSPYLNLPYCAALRLADVLVHLGMLIHMPYRIDHLAALLMHLVKYADIQLPSVVTFPVKVGPGYMTFDDVVDVLAHTVSALLFMSPSAFGSAVALAEAQRWILRAKRFLHANPHIVDSHRASMSQVHSQRKRLSISRDT